MDKRQDGINILSSGARLLIFMNQGYYPYGRRVNNLGDWHIGPEEPVHLTHGSENLSI